MRTDDKSVSVNAPASNDTREPEFLYRYCTLNKHTERIFTHNEIYFPSPDKFNDPFDSKIRLIPKGTRQQERSFFLEELRKLYPNAPRRELQGRAKEISKSPELKRQYIERLNKLGTSHITELGVLSLTENKENILMWAHYAAQHTGFCLEFDAYNLFFARALPVGYDVSLPTLNLIQRHQREDIVDMLLTKAKDWEYEQEWRIVDHENGPGVQSFPEEALTGVILGCRMQDGCKNRIRDWCSKRQPRPTLYQAREKETEFGLNIVDVPY